MAGQTKDLHDFLAEAELQHYYTSFMKDLNVSTIAQIKNIEDHNLIGLGMSKPEVRRLRQFFKKQSAHGALNRFKKAFTKSPGDTSPGGLSISERQSHSSMSSDKRLISEDSIVTIKTLGCGEFGVVQLCIWTTDAGEQIQVAAKCLKKNKVHVGGAAEFLQKSNVIQSIDHARIVRLFGVVLGPDSYILVTELAPLRSLLHCLREISLRGNFGVLALCDLASQIAEGMTYLESRQLIHCNLAARNILMFDKDKCKISDFGLSEMLGLGKDDYESRLGENDSLPAAWWAPECIDQFKLSTSSDVWAYGVTLWEMFSYGAQPWVGHTTAQLQETYDSSDFLRLPRPDHCPYDWYEMLLRCWDRDVHSRPMFSQISSGLSEMRPSRVMSSRDNLKLDIANTEGCLRYKSNEFITVLSKTPSDAPRPGMWMGVLEHDNLVGFFDVHNTTPVLEMSVNSPALRKIKLNRAESSKVPNTSRQSVRTSHRLDASMISGPQDDFRHIGHVGYDGAIFGDVSFMGDNDKLLPKASSRQNSEEGRLAVSLPINGTSNPARMASNQSPVGANYSCSIASNNRFDESSAPNIDDDFGDFTMPDLSMGFDLESSSLMDDVMKAFTTVSDNDVNSHTHVCNEASSSVITNTTNDNSESGTLADSEDDEDEASSESTAGPSSPNEGNSRTESEGEGNGENNSQFDSSSCSSLGGATHGNEEADRVKKLSTEVKVAEVRRQYSNPDHK